MGLLKNISITLSYVVFKLTRLRITGQLLNILHIMSTVKL